MSRKGPIGDSWVSCPTPGCGKRAYTSKRAARHQRRVVEPAATMNVYECQDSGYYHFGHVPSAVRSGEVSRDDWLADVARTRQGRAS